MENKRILVVEDNEKDLKLVRDYLLAHGYTVTIARNGNEAFNQAQTDKPDLIIMDIMMSELNGWKACDKIKNDPSSRHIPILMCSSSIKDDGEFGKYETGDSYIQKPVNLDRLLLLVKDLLNRNSNQ